MNSTPGKTSVTLVKEEVTLANGQIFVPVSVANPSDALRASLLMLFKHVSDVHVSIVEIIAEKFQLNVDDIHNAIKEDPRWTDMLTNPLIHDLTAAATNETKPKGKRKAKLSTLTPEEKAANKAATKAQNKAKRETKKQQKQQEKQQQQIQPEEEELVF